MVFVQFTVGRANPPDGVGITDANAAGGALPERGCVGSGRVGIPHEERIELKILVPQEARRGEVEVGTERVPIEG